MVKTMLTPPDASLITGEDNAAHGKYITNQEKSKEGDTVNMGEHSINSNKPRHCTC